MFNDFILYFDILIIWYFIFLNTTYGILLIATIPAIIKRFYEVEIEESGGLFPAASHTPNERLNIYPPITIIAPAYNEEMTVIQSVNCMLRLNYLALKVIIVNDGSKDNTLEVLREEFELFEVPTAITQKIRCKSIISIFHSKKYKNLMVIDKENGGKADALNAGINACHTPLFLAVDADTIIEKDALTRLVRPVLKYKNVVATGGTIRIVNNCIIEDGDVVKVRYPKKLLPAIQVVEYLRAFLFGRIGWNECNGNLVVSGAFGLFDKRVVVECGGYLTDTVGEDIELIIRIHHKLRKEGVEYRIEFVPDPVAWTEAPSTLSVLARQRERWHRGLIDSLYRHKTMMFNPRYGLLGMVVFPFFVFGELLAPLIEGIGIIGFLVGLYFGAINWEYFIVFVLSAWGYSFMLTLFSVILEEITFKRYENKRDIFKMYLCVFIENLGYRQLTVLWRLQGFYKFAIGSKSWGEMKRYGFTQVKRKKKTTKISP